MSFVKNGKKEKKSSPTPLPMYEPVKLRHVPTMVRRRYDKDLLKLTSETQEDDNKSKSDEAVVSHVDDELEEYTEMEDDSLANIDTHHHTTDFGSTSAISCSEDCLDEDREAKNYPISYVDKTVQDEVDENDEQDLQVEDCKSDGYATKCANVAVYNMDDSVQNELEDKEGRNIDNEEVKLEPKQETKEFNSPLPLPMYVPIVLKHVPTIVRRKDTTSHKFDVSEEDSIDDVVIDSHDCSDDYAQMEVDNTKHDFISHDLSPSSKDSEITEDGRAEEEDHASSIDVTVENGHVISENDKVKVVDETNGQETPASLYYKPSLLLKHVPTIVIRRYDPRLERQQKVVARKGLALEDIESQRNEVDEVDDDEEEIDSHGCSDDDAQMEVDNNKHDFVSHDLSPSSKDSEITEDGRVEEEDHASSIDVTVETGHEISENDKVKVVDASNGQETPAPLYYKPSLLLKHVPTIVIRRYDPRLERQQKVVARKGLALEDIESQGDEVDEDDSSVTTDNDAEDVTPTPSIDFVSHFEDSKSQEGVDEYENHASNLDDCVHMKVKVDEPRITHNEQDASHFVGSKSQEGVDEYENHASNLEDLVHMKVNVDEPRITHNEQDVLEWLGVHTTTYTRLDKLLIWIRKRYNNTKFRNKAITVAVIATRGGPRI